MVDNSYAARDKTNRPQLTRSSIEELLEALLGRPRVSLRDAHTELVMVDRQRALLTQVASRKATSLFSVEEVELLLDAIEEYGDCTLPDILQGGLHDFAPPPLTAEEVRTVITVGALRMSLDPQQFLTEINLGLVKEQVRLRSAFVGEGRLQSEPVTARLGPATETAGDFSRPDPS